MSHGAEIFGPEKGPPQFNPLHAAKSKGAPAPQKKMNRNVKKTANSVGNAASPIGTPGDKKNARKQNAKIDKQRHRLPH